MSDLSPTQTQALHVGPETALPHDPLALVLYARRGEDPAKGLAAGALDGIEIDSPRGVLTLAPGPSFGRSLTEPSGSFGGLRPPLNVAVTEGSDVFLADGAANALYLFDPCECRFMPVPCFASLAELPGPSGFVPLDRLRGPTGLAVAGTRLLIADTGNHRVVIMRMVGAVPAAALRLPKATGRRADWAPYAIVVDGQRRIWVSDRLHGRLDRFDPSGRWEAEFTTLGEVAELAVDCAGTLYAVLRDGMAPRAIALVGGEPVAVIDAPDRLPCFPHAPVRTDAQGRLHLCCADGSVAIFDGRGDRVSDKVTAALLPFVKRGTYLSRALDSHRRGCVWHRVALAGTLPERGVIKVQTTTSDVELNAAELDDLPPEAWNRPIALRSLERGIGDVLVMSPPGRYLWLRLTFVSDGHASPLVSHIVVEFPRVSLRRYLPGVFGMDPLAADFTDRFTALFDTTLRSIEQRIDTGHELFSTSTAPADKPRDADTDFLSWLASWVGVVLNRHWPEAVRRRMLKEAASSYTLRGTSYGLWRQLVVFLGLDRDCGDACASKSCHPPRPNCAPDPCPPDCCRPVPPPLILEHFRLRRWLFLGAGRLGDDAVLWGDRIVNRSRLDGNARLGPLPCPLDGKPATQLVATPDPQRDPFLRDAHRATIFVPACVKTQDWRRRGLEQLLRQEMPAHVAWDIDYVAPRFRVGVQATIGLDSVIARVPQGVRLGNNRLGQGTVLPAHRGRLPTVGKDTRVGQAMRLI